jgi:SNF2 family DNA or RNA helicase
MEFLKSGLLGTRNYRAFVAEYAEILHPNHPMLLRMAARNPRIVHAQIVKRDADGRPCWRNLPRLQRLLEPHSFRVRKAECLDLPSKIYQRHYFELHSNQRTAYRLMMDEHRAQLSGQEITPVQALAVGLKLQQITSGFLLYEGKVHYVSEGNPRLTSLLDLVEDCDGQLIVWARFREEIRAIAERLSEANISAVTYFGDTSRADREDAVDKFQAGKVRVFIGNQQTAGLGLTLTAAELVIYYSNDFSLEHRLQSEDRSHRKGTTHSVVYIDLVATDSIDEVIATALQAKSDLAAAITGDIQ